MSTVPRAPHGTEKRYRWDKRHKIEPCVECAEANAQAAKRRREDKQMPANQVRAEYIRAPKPAQRDHVAPAMVREWSSAQRHRIRGILLQLVAASSDPLHSPEMQVVALIDQAGADR